MSRFGAEYHIARASGRCTATDQELPPGSQCIATLCERADDEGFDRMDFSLDVWEAGHRPQGLFSYWRTTVPQPDAKPRILIDDQVLTDLFERLASDERPQRIAFRFVLALILIRKKQYKFVGRVTDATPERWLLQPRGVVSDVSQPPIQVVNPNLSDDDVRDLVDQLSEVLQTEL